MQFFWSYFDVAKEIFVFRQEVVTIKVSVPDIRLYKLVTIEGEDEEEMVPCQLSPVFDAEGQILNNEFHLSFVVSIKGLALDTYFIKQLRPEDGGNP